MRVDNVFAAPPHCTIVQCKLSRFIAGDPDVSAGACRTRLGGAALAAPIHRRCPPLWLLGGALPVATQTRSFRLGASRSRRSLQPPRPLPSHNWPGRPVLYVLRDGATLAATRLPACLPPPPRTAAYLRARGKSSADFADGFGKASDARQIWQDGTCHESRIPQPRAHSAARVVGALPVGVCAGVPPPEIPHLHPTASVGTCCPVLLFY